MWDTVQGFLVQQGILGIAVLILGVALFYLYRQTLRMNAQFQALNEKRLDDVRAMLENYREDSSELEKTLEALRVALERPKS